MNEKYIYTFEKFNILTKKSYLSKKQLKQSFILLFGIKLDYQELQDLWNSRIDFYNKLDYIEKNEFENTLLLKGVTLKYFIYICENFKPTQNQEQQLNFQSLSFDNCINESEFLNHFKEFKADYINIIQRKKLFQLISEDGKQIKLEDYIKFIKND